MDDPITLNRIIELKQRLLKDKHPHLLKRKLGEYAEDIEINTPINNAYTDSMCNRGHKLFTDESLQLSNLKSYPSSWKYDFLDDGNKNLIVNSDIYSNKKAKLYKFYDSNGNSVEVQDTEEKSYDDDDEEEEDEDDNPMASINLTEILAPIQHPSDVVTRKSFAKIFNPEKEGNHLLKLAYDTIEMIESEQDNVIKLTQLMNMFLGDEYQELTPDNINLPDYDHKLSLKDLNASTISNPKELFQEESEANDEEDTTKDEDDNRKLQTRSKDNANITDPFFQLPNFKQNKTIDSIDPQEAEETRQLTQITLQRNQEYIRCLTKIRNGCVKVDKFKQNIYKWSKEMNGDYSEVEISDQSKESSIEKE